MKTHHAKSSNRRVLSDRWWLIALAITALLLVAACLEFVDYEQRNARVGHVVFNSSLDL